MVSCYLFMLCLVDFRDEDVAGLKVVATTKSLSKVKLVYIEC